MTNRPALEQTPSRLAVERVTEPPSRRASSSSPTAGPHMPKYTEDATF
ncbi:hypothetical protein [Streptomyces sp. NPDC012510]